MNVPVLVALMASIFLVAVASGIATPILPVYAKALGAEGLWIGLIFGTEPVFRALFGVVFGRLADRQGIKRFLLLGLSGYALASFGFARVATPIHLFSWRLVQGGSSSMLHPLVQGYVGALTPKGREGSVISLLYLFFLGGFAIGPVAGGYLADRMGYRGPFLLMGALALAALILILVLVPEHKSMRSENGPPPSMIQILQDRTVRSIMLAMCVISLTWGAFLVCIPIWCADLGLPALVAGVLISVWSVTEAVLQPVTGMICDRVNRTGVVLVGLILAPLVLVLAPGARQVWPLIFVTVLLGVGDAAFLPAITAMAVERGRDLGMSSVMGVKVAAMGVGQALGAVMAGFLMDLVGVPGSFRIIAVMGVTGLLAFVWLSRKEPPLGKPAVH
ncbi:MAG: MFS transporter [Bacillota bacterium]